MDVNTLWICMMAKGPQLFAGHQRLKWSQESAARGVDTLTLDAPALPCCRSPRIVAPRHLRIFWHAGVWKVRWSSQGLTEMEADHEKQEAYLDKGVPFRQSTLWADSDEPAAADDAEESVLPEGGIASEDFKETELDETGRVLELGGGLKPPSLAMVQSLCTGCSCVVALHADQAAEGAVRFAVEHGLAFAVVPCCVYAEDFPKRRLPDGRPVTSLDALIEYLTWLGGDDAKVETLQFSGKNVVVFSKPKCAARVDKAARDAHLCDLMRCATVGSVLNSMAYLGASSQGGQNRCWRDLVSFLERPGLHLADAAADKYGHRGIQPESKEGLPLDPTVQLAMAQREIFDEEFDRVDAGDGLGAGGDDGLQQETARLCRRVVGAALYKHARSASLVMCLVHVLVDIGMDVEALLSELCLAARLEM
ncbi:hypothetical protein AK812_SmicGene20137 [Symbiodinium microadriaticum]|uniref:Uncharacterized protein n=1 Tax=Symbiodinium microadriaticum TaxID=2951 RepID=A0A1Q9DQN2_SYMMI|nr:hypothetical protein AK812_SmicGene20137 [Symbiodinium microadriaticum]